MNDQIKNIILEKTNSTSILKTEVIQKLWSGYGELSRIKLDHTSIILKHIKFPDEQEHPRAWSSDLSHKRKVKSYQVEFSWYQLFNKTIPSSYTPKLITSGEIGKQHYLVLEDLAAVEFHPLEQIDWDQTKLCLKWLASFHNQYMGTPPNNLWEVGSYWHLETRPDELQVIKDPELKNAAALIDHKLNSAKYKTIVHGDAKLANFLFSNEQVAAVDFQYTGGGVGIKDVAYFLSSIYNAEELFQNEEKCLEYYFKQLNNPEIELEWRSLYSYAWADFYRFLVGWSPDHWKINSYSKLMKNKVIKDLNMFHTLCDLAKEAASSAGKVIQKAIGTQVEVNIKDDQLPLAAGVVTEIDHKAQEEILKIISPILNKFDLGLLTEELPDDGSRIHKEYFWCIDPLDGTLQFSQNQCGFSVSIGLVAKDGTPILGVVYDPRNENLYHALKGHGAFKNNKPFKVNRSTKEVTNYSQGPAVMNAIKTIENAPATFIKMPKKDKGGGCLWDYAASSVIHAEAGGVNSDYNGKRINLNNLDTVFLNNYGVRFLSSKDLA